VFRSDATIRWLSGAKRARTVYSIGAFVRSRPDSNVDRHTPRKRSIQYAEPSVSIVAALQYRVTRWSLSSGGALRRPGGG
jgi:hypothetical protein